MGDISPFLSPIPIAKFSTGKFKIRVGYIANETKNSEAIHFSTFSLPI